MKRVLTYLIIPLMAGFLACSDDDDTMITPVPDEDVDETPASIVEIAQDTENLSTLVQALQTADLVDALSGPGPFTVLAPVNSAFQALLDSNEAWNNLEDIDEDLLRQVLLYHVAEGTVNSADLSEGDELTMLSGAIVTVTSVSQTITFNNSANVLEGDIAASNGVIHIIDAVLVPEMGDASTLTLTDHPELGTVFTDGQGNTLYYFSNDVGGENNCSGGCADNWPIYYAEDIDIDNPSFDVDLIGEIEVDGNMQTTYNGWPLYYFANDAAPGDANGDGANSVWYAAMPDYSIMVANEQLVGADGENYIIEEGDYIIGEGRTQYFVDFNTGRTLYAFANDEANQSNYGGNPENWPLYTTEAMTLPSTISTDDFNAIDNDQVTFRANPIYFFGQDMDRGDTRGVSVPQPGIWQIINSNTESLNGVDDAATVTITLGNAGASAYTIANIEGADMADVVSGDPDENPTLNLTEGVRYIFIVNNMGPHPLDFRNAENEILLSFNDAEGSFEGDSAVDFQKDSDNSLSFTLTSELAAVISEYACTVHAGSMRGTIAVN